MEEDETLNLVKDTTNSQVNKSAYEEGNPDFDKSKDCPEARGACYLQDIMANEKVEEK